jgi:hypothetical protein
MRGSVFRQCWCVLYACMTCRQANLGFPGDNTSGKPKVRAEARGFEPRMGANPNRISSAAP